MTIDIDPNALLELAFARLDLQQAWEDESQANTNLDQAEYELREVQDGDPIVRRRDWIFETIADVASRLSQDEPDWEEFDWILDRLAAEKTAGAKRDQAAAEVDKAKQAIERIERAIKARTDSICQLQIDELWRAEQAYEATSQALKEAAEGRRQAEAKALDLAEQVWRIRRLGGGETELEEIFSQGQEIQALLDRAREIVVQAKAEVERAIEANSEASRRAAVARREKDLAEEEVKRQLYRMLPLLERRPEMAPA